MAESNIKVNGLLINPMVGEYYMHHQMAEVEANG